MTTEAGARPKYCDLADESGKALHTAMTAFRARAALDRRAGATQPDDLGRPVTMATARAAELRTDVARNIGGLMEKMPDRRPKGVW